MLEICPYCARTVEKDDPDRMIIHNSVVVCHGICHKAAIENIIHKTYLTDDYRERN